MRHSLPEPVVGYFEVINGAEPDRLTLHLVPDASVRDEGHTYRGLDAIKSWVRETRMKFEYMVEPQDVMSDGERLTVTTTVTGNFPGSPVQLDHIFQLADRKISSLEIR